MIRTASMLTLAAGLIGVFTAAAPVHAQQAEITIITTVNADGLLEELSSFFVFCFVCDSEPCEFSNKLGDGGSTIQTNGASSVNEDVSIGISIDNPDRTLAGDITNYTCQLQFNGSTTESLTPQPDTPLVLELTGPVNQ